MGCRLTEGRRCHPPGSWDPAELSFASRMGPPVRQLHGTTWDWAGAGRLGGEHLGRPAPGRAVNPLPGLPGAPGLSGPLRLAQPGRERLAGEEAAAHVLDGPLHPGLVGPITLAKPPSGLTTHPAATIIGCSHAGP
jgi:hypothetical protein